MCLSVFVTHAQNPDSIFHRNQRMKWVEKVEAKYGQKSVFSFNEKEISLEDYLSLPEDSIGGCEECAPLRYNNPNPMFYVYSKGNAPRRVWEDSKDTGPQEGLIQKIPFYMSGGIPPRFSQGGVSLWKYVQGHRQIPDSLYQGDLANMVVRVEVFSFFDEAGRIVDARVEKVHLSYPLVCDIILDRNFNDPISRLTKSGVLSKECGHLLDRITRDALSVVKGLPDFEPGKVHLQPVKYRITIPVGYWKSVGVVMNYNI